MADQYQFMPSDSGGTTVAMTSSAAMVAAAIFLFLVVVFVFFLYLYVRRYLGPNQSLGSRSRIVFVEGLVPGPGCGLDAAVLRSLPVTVYRAADFQEGLECAVCLSELADGDEARLLPKCNHCFHVECIDMWFHSHATCPLCRSPVRPQTLDATVSVEADEPAQAPVAEALQELPTNVSFWGSADHQVNAESTAAAKGDGEGPSCSSGDSAKRNPGGALVIEIPSRAVEANYPSPISPLPPSMLPTEEMKSPPAPSRFRSLTRLLSRGKRPAGPSYSPSPRAGDIEHGLRGAEGSALTPKTPAS